MHRSSTIGLLIANSLFLSANAARAFHADRKMIQTDHAARYEARRQTIRWERISYPANQHEMKPDVALKNSPSANLQKMVAISPSHFAATSKEKQESGTERVKARQIEHSERFVIQRNFDSVIKLDNGVDLDLTSASRNVVLGTNLFHDDSTVTIEVGGQTRTVSAGSEVTVAEYVAVKQVLHGGPQKIVVDDVGKAIGGEVVLNMLVASRNSMTADNLVISENVTAIGNFSKHSSFRLSGDLINHGSLYAFSSKDGKHSAEISANNITNFDGAVISTDAPESFHNRQIDLNLTGDKSFSNFGKIETSGNLSISAPSMVNGGAIISKNGDVTLDAPINTELNIHNNGGRIEAINGSISLRTPDYVGTSATNLIGGDLVSKNLTVNAGQGLATVDVQQLTGVVSGSGLAAHVNANTETLTLGKVCLTGDPTFYNTGDIVLNGNISVGEALAILAEGSITSTAACDLIEARVVGGNGFSINILAGFDLTSTGATTTSVPGTPSAANVSVDGPAPIGGNVDLHLSNGLQINTFGSGANSSGGEVRILAKDVAGNGGNVLLPTNSDINTGGTGTGANGDITILAGLADQITVGGLIASGGVTTKGGVVYVANSNITPSSGAFFAPDGQLNGSLLRGGQVPTGSVIMGGGGAETIVGNDGSIDIIGGNITISENIFSNGILTIRAEDSGIVLKSQIQSNAQAILFSLGGDINIDGGSLTGPGFKTIQAGGPHSDVILNGGPISGKTMVISTNDGDIKQSPTAPITTDYFQLGVSGGTADLSIAVNSIGQIETFGYGPIMLNNGNTALKINDIGSQDFTATTTAAGGMTLSFANVNTAGTINLTTDVFNGNARTIQAHEIIIQSNPGQGLTINGGAGLGTLFKADVEVSLIATFNNLVMNGSTRFGYGFNTDLYALNGTDRIVISPGASVTGAYQLTLHTCNLQLQGTVTGTPLILDNPCGSATIANNGGDVVLQNDITYNGSNLAIIASGSIYSPLPITINLSNSAGNGGNLTLIAGYNFNPATNGQVIDGVTTYMIDGYSASGGNIGAMDIITNGSAGSNGGSVLAIAHTGTVPASGLVSLTNITTNGVVGGNVTIIADNNIQLNSIDTTGSITGGNISIISAQPSSGIGNKILNGTFTGSFAAGPNAGRSVGFTSVVNAGNGNVTLTGDLFAPNDPVVGNVVTLNDSNGIGIDPSNRYLVDATTVTGSASLDAFISNVNVAPANLGTFTVGSKLDVSFVGDLTTSIQSAAVIALTTSGGLNVTGLLNGSSAITLTSGTNITNANIAKDNLSTEFLTLCTANGASIGTAGSNSAFEIGGNVKRLSVNTVLLGGASANIHSLSTTGVELDQSKITNDFAFLADGPLKVVGDVTNQEGNINITTLSGTLQVSDLVSIRANSTSTNGNIFIGNAISGGDRKNTSIVIGSGTQIIASAGAKPGGNVKIQIGLPASKIVNLVAPRQYNFLTKNGGLIQGGSGGRPFAVGKKTAGSISADDAVVLITNTMKKKNLVLLGGAIVAGSQ